MHRVTFPNGYVDYTCNKSTNKLTVTVNRAVINLNTTKTCRKVCLSNATIYYSYSTPVCVKFDNQEVAQATKQKYSRTTSKQQATYIARDLKGKVEYVEPDVFKALLEEVY